MISADHPGRKSLILHLQTLPLLASVALLGLLLACLYLGGTRFVDYVLNREVEQLVPAFDDLGTLVLSPRRDIGLRRVRSRAQVVPEISEVAYFDQRGNFVGGFRRKGEVSDDSLPLERFPGRQLTDRTVFGFVMHRMVVVPMEAEYLPPDEMFDFSLDHPPRSDRERIGYLRLDLSGIPVLATFVAGGALAVVPLLALLVLAVWKVRAHVRASMADLERLQEPLHRVVSGSGKVELPSGSGWREIAVVEDALSLLMARIHTLEAGKERVGTRLLALLGEELRAPLNQVVGFEEFLRDELVDLRNHELAGVADRAAITTKHLLQGLQDVIDYVNLDNGTCRLNAAPIGLAELCRRLPEQFAALAGGDAGALRLEVATDARVFADEAKLERVLLYLGLHLHQEMGCGGICIATEQRVGEIVVSLSAEPPERWGGAPRTWRGQEGGEFGLVIGRHFVAAMGGKLWEDPTASGFRLSLAAAAPAALEKKGREQLVRAS